jgi:hypothetical protein
MVGQIVDGLEVNIWWLKRLVAQFLDVGRVRGTVGETRPFLRLEGRDCDCGSWDCFSRADGLARRSSCGRSGLGIGARIGELGFGLEVPLGDHGSAFLAGLVSEV